VQVFHGWLDDSLHPIASHIKYQLTVNHLGGDAFDELVIRLQCHRLLAACLDVNLARTFDLDALKFRQFSLFSC